jgi:hypothetical protein
MADKKISALTASTTPLAGTEVLPIVQGGATVKVSVANLTAGRATSASSLTATTGGVIVTGGPTGYGGDEIAMQTTSATYSAISTQMTGTGVFYFDHRGTSNTGSWIFRNGSGGATTLAIIDLTGTYPGTDNNRTLGTAANRWSVVYAGSPVINTSDERLKQQVRQLSGQELAVAKRCKSLLKTFKFNDAVEKKGDKARIHFGVIAQEVVQAFEAEGLNPDDYGLFCYDKWDDKFEPEFVEVEEINNEGQTVKKLQATGQMKLVQAAGDRFGIRYESLLAFIIAAM